MARLRVAPRSLFLLAGGCLALFLLFNLLLASRRAGHHGAGGRIDSRDGADNPDASGTGGGDSIAGNSESGSDGDADGDGDGDGDGEGESESESDGGFVSWLFGSGRHDGRTAGQRRRKSIVPWCSHAKANEAARSLSVTLENFAGALFVGHINPDTDSVAASIAAAHYYGGVAATAGKINPETTLVLDKFKLSVPPLVSTFPSDQHACLVDFNQRTQLVPYISEDNVVCVIDHHAMQKDTVEISKPIHVEIKTWGSCSTVLAWKYFDTCRDMPREIAGVLLSGIVSDTLFLRSPTTTIADQRAVQRLARLAGVKDLLGWAREMFAVKDQFGEMTIDQIVASDFKEFAISDKRVGFGVLETVNLATQQQRKDELLNAACSIKKRRRLHYTFFAIVDVLELHSVLLVCSKTEKDLALLAYPDAAVVDDFQLDLGNRVSRKKEFIPPLQRQFRHFSSL